jgi:hypothetical protein
LSPENGKTFGQETPYKENPMRVKLLFGTIFLWALGAHAADKVQPLNLKPGLWEITGTVSMSGNGGSPLSREQLDKLTPEQRTRFEQAWKQALSQTPKARTYEQCLKAEDVNKADAMFGEDKSWSCNRTVVSSSSSKLEFHEQCVHEGMKVNRNVRMEASNPESVTGLIEQTAAGGEGVTKSSSTFTSKWLGSSCKGTK